MFFWMKERIRAVAAADPIGHEITTMLISLVWAVCLLTPPSNFGTSASFDVLASVADEEMWGVLAGLVAVAKLAGIVQGSYAWRRVSALFAMLFWGTVGLALMLANPTGTGAWTYSCIAVSAAWSFLWLGAHDRR